MVQNFRHISTELRGDKGDSISLDIERYGAANSTLRVHITGAYMGPDYPARAGMVEGTGLPNQGCSFHEIRGERILSTKLLEKLFSAEGLKKLRDEVSEIDPEIRRQIGI